MIAFISGGGGHLGIAYSISKYLEGEDLVFVIPENDKYSREKLRGSRYFEIPRLRKPNEGFFKALMNSPRALISSFKLPKFKIVVSTGPNISIIPSIIKKVGGAKLINVEVPDRIVNPSLTAKILYPLSDLTALSWQEQLINFKKGKVFGPVYEEPEHEVKEEGEFLLFLTGTYGFQVLIEEIAKCDFKGENVVVQYGRADITKLKGRGFTLFEFDSDIGKWIARSKVVISHLGMSPINASLGYGKPVVIIRNPEWKLAGKEDDAEKLAQKIGAVVSRAECGEMKEAIERAKSIKPPKLLNGAKGIASEIKEMLYGKS